MKSQVLMSDGSVAQGVVAINRSGQSGFGDVYQAVPDFDTPTSLLEAYGYFGEVAPGDFVTVVKTSNGQQIMALSAGPLQTGESRVTLNVPVITPCALEVEASCIRNRHQFSTLTMFSNGDDGLPSPTPDPINIISISQSTADAGAAYNGSAGTVATVVLETALPSGPHYATYLTDWVHISGLVDSRLNYQNACIKFISADRKTITFSFSDESALPSLAVPVITPALGSAKVYFYNNMGGASDGFGLRFTGTIATSAVIVSMFGNGDAQVSGALFSDHRQTIASTAPQYFNGIMGNFDLKATSRYRLEARPTECIVMDKGIESATTAFSVRASRTSVKPAVKQALRPRFRVYQPVGMSRPVASIVTITKAGSTTWTVTTEDAHGLVSGNYVTIKGVRDQTNFASFATPAIVTVTGLNTFTLIGVTGTATSHGGSVILCNGAVDQPGIIGQSVLTMANYTVNPDWIVIVGNTAWAGLAIGDYINIHGNHGDATGADVGATGVWEVANLLATQLIVKPVYDIMGVRVSPVTPTLTGTVNCGGSVILRTTLRMHDLMLEQWAENKVMIDGQGTARVDKAVPVNVVGGGISVIQSTPAAISTSTGAGGWFIQPAVVGIGDIASSVITTTGTSATFANNLGNGFQVNVAVTAVTGTTPTLDVRVEESFDGGTNWLTLYEFQRITANGSYNSPVMRATGRHIRYVRTITGTTPSFTMAVVRNILPFIQAEPQKRLMDRSIVLTTLDSVTPVLFQGAANTVQLIINIGAATTPPVLQIEGSEDGANWYAMGAPLTAVASSTVQLTVSGLSATYTRARVSTAGVAVTAGYVSIKAWS